MAVRDSARCLPRDARGQMTVELVVVLPVVIVVALVAFNALAFLGACAEFDRLARNAVRVAAAAPTQVLAEQMAAEAEAALAEALGAPNVEVSVEGSAPTFELARFTCLLEYHPTLFGLSMRQEVLGVPLPPLSHAIELEVFSYDPLF